MLLLGFYIFVVLVALIWVASDVNATAVFEIFQPWLHSTVRSMDMYWEWLFYCLWRCAILFTLVAMNLTVTEWVLEQNPFNLEPFARKAVFAAMLVGSLAIFSFPCISSYIRFRRFLDSKAVELTGLVSLVTSVKDISHHFEPAEYETSAEWSAWHPMEDEWQESECWTEIIPVVYICQKTALSLIVPVDWEHFLVWGLPLGSVEPGRHLPVYGPGKTAFLVKTIHELRGQPGWSVVSADMEDEVA